MRKRILITGANSQIGLSAIEALTADYEVCATDQNPILDTPPHQFINPSIFVEGDLRNPDFVSDLLKGIDSVVHCEPWANGLEHENISSQERLDRTTRGSYILSTEAMKGGVQRLILASSLRMFRSLPGRWRITESWRPRPEATTEDLCPWLAELCIRECSRASSLDVLCLRFADLTKECDASGSLLNSHSVHVTDAQAAIRGAIAAPQFEPYERNWRVFHIPAASSGAHMRLTQYAGTTLNYSPRHPAPGDYTSNFTRNLKLEKPGKVDPMHGTISNLAPGADRSYGPIRKVVVFGAGGPVSAALATEMASNYTLRLTDVLPIADIVAAAVPQYAGAPLPVVMKSPHECLQVDVRDERQVSIACRGMDAIVNNTVVRHDTEQAFLVNTIGAYNVMKAAVENGIRRVVHTGPQLVDSRGNSNIGYSLDYDVPGDAPARPGNERYGLSKYLGQEICRVFAEQYNIEVPVLLFCHFFNPELLTPGTLHPMAISWRDSGTAIRRAIEAPSSSFPSPYEVMNVAADFPHRVYTNSRACALLGWQPQDQMDSLFTAE